MTSGFVVPIFCLFLYSFAIYSLLYSCGLFCASIRFHGCSGGIRDFLLGVMITQFCLRHCLVSRCLASSLNSNRLIPARPLIAVCYYPTFYIRELKKTKEQPKLKVVQTKEKDYLDKKQDPHAA